MDRKYAIGCIILHKLYVLVAGIWLRVPLWQLLVHDLSKFGRRERKYRDHELPFSWNFHANRNPHHCEFWYSRTGGRGCGNFKNAQCLPMPERYVREMVADWFATARANDGVWPNLKDWAWFKENFSLMLMHTETRSTVLTVLEQQGFEL